MRNFEKKLEEATEEELYFWVNERDFRIVHLASDELTRRSLNKLRETMRIFNNKSSKQTQEIIRLTRWIVGLTIIMVIGLIVQIILSL